MNYGRGIGSIGEHPFVDGHRHEAARRAVLSGRHDEGRVREGGTAGQGQTVHVVRRRADGRRRRPYHVAYRATLGAASAEAPRSLAKLAEGRRFQEYLRVAREGPCSTTTTSPATWRWMDMKTNPIDIVIGPIKTYEDAAVRLQGGVRRLRADQGPRLEREAAALCASCRPCRKDSRCRMRTRPRSRAPTPTSTRTTPCSTPARESGSKTIAIKLSRTTKKCSSRKARAACSWKTSMQAKSDKILEADRVDADRGRPAAAHHVRCVLRERNVSRSRAGLGIKNTSTARARCAPR